MITQQIPHATTISALRTRVRTWRDDRLSVGFVPTMGALHDGHLSLVRLAKAQCDRVVTSIFVNPKQFAAGEDLDAYPRTLIPDAEKLTDAKCDLIYLPTPEIMYPEGYSANLILKGPAIGLEAAVRPHFFDGVATVVAKLFNQVRPDMAFFGEKDYQQLLVIRQLVKDLDFPVEILAGETGRDKDGLALSSRNVYLDADQRARAGQLNLILKDFAAALSAGSTVSASQATALAKANDVFDAVDYVEARCATSLAELGDGVIDRPTRVLAAVRLGSTRLIDNMAAKPPS
ncbi:pantoate--beta-alanine ligase [Maricaulis sp. W15]|uniref:pantoate--beta-alanine ligase n=1 Tax=Maricaulis sp. W15 TaxID=1772333 RepID=UPI000948B7C5|nr:pantoate--beta-alanine ligase [Maricaulis sp. W15]OLF73171.1 pantoate--beta-alanine ligase [Maricaulis sp. W15]